MKKILIACAAATMSLAALTSCGNSGSDSANDGLGDSISVAFGKSNGAQFAMSYLSIPESERGSFNKESILRGLKEVIMADTADQGFLAGLSIGLNLNQTLANLEQSGISVDRRKFYDEFAKAFKADSVAPEEMAKLQSELQGMMQRAQEMAQAKKQKELEESPEAKANTKAGEEYIAKQMKEDSAVKKSDTGLAYKIEAEGAGEAPTDADEVAVKYVGRHIDGTEFDSSNGEAVNFRLGQVIPGFSEGLKLLKKGGKATLYIPAALAYGAHGTNNIGPMETLVFEVELVDINPAHE